jgi:hypothetical protein
MVFRIETPACVEFKKNSNSIYGIFFRKKNTKLERFDIVVLSCWKMGFLISR